MCVSDLSTCTTHSHHTGMKVARTSKPENGDDGQGAARRVQDKVLVRGLGGQRPTEAPTFKLF